MLRYRGRRPVTPASVALVAAAVVVAGLTAYLVTSRVPARYEARATLLVGAAGGGYTDLLAAQILTQTYAQLATTKPVLTAGADRAGLRDLFEAGGVKVSATPSRESLIVTVVGEAADPEDAAAIANGVAAELETVVPSQDPRTSNAQRSLFDNLAAVGEDIVAVRSEITRLRRVPSPSPFDTARLSSFEERLTALQVAQATILAEARQMGINLVRVIDPAAADSRPASPNVMLNTVLASAIAFMAAAAFVAFPWWTSTLRR